MFKDDKILFDEGSFNDENNKFNVRGLVNSPLLCDVDILVDYRISSSVKNLIRVSA